MTPLDGLIVILVFAGLGAMIGGCLVFEVMTYRREKLRKQAADLQAEWQALETAQRLQATFQNVRRAMWEEAIRQHHRQWYQEPDVR